MSFQIQAIYENGVLKPDKPLPLGENQRVTVVVVEETPGAARSIYGVIGWRGDPATIRKVALDSEFGVAESP